MFQVITRDVLLKLVAFCSIINITDTEFLIEVLEIGMKGDFLLNAVPVLP